MNIVYRTCRVSRLHTIALLVTASIGFSTGCAKESNDVAPLEWMGDQPHFAIRGTLNGENLDVTLEGDAAKDLENLHCLREYQVPSEATSTDETDAGVEDWENGKMSEVQVIVQLNVNGTSRELDLELKRHNYQADEVGTEVTIIPRDDSKEPGSTEMWSEIEWYENDENIYEQASQEGTFVLKRFTGTPGEDNPLVIPENTGSVGGVLTAKWSPTETVSISFTADCTGNSVEIIGE